jgi:hypothetical protein
MRAIRLSAVALVTVAAVVIAVSSASAATTTAAPAHVYATRIVDVTVPATHEVHSSFKITGTDSDGGIEIEPAGTLNGTFKIVFPAQGNFLGSSAEQSLS